MNVAMENLARLPLVLREFGRAFIHWRQWGLLWVGALAPQMLASGCDYDRQAVGTLWSMGILQLMGYIVAYLANTNTWSMYDLLPMTLDRLLMQVSPVAALLIGLSLLGWDIVNPNPLPAHRASVTPSTQDAMQHICNHKQLTIDIEQSDEPWESLPQTAKYPNYLILTPSVAFCTLLLTAPAHSLSSIFLHAHRLTPQGRGVITN